VLAVMPKLAQQTEILASGIGKRKAVKLIRVESKSSTS